MKSKLILLFLSVSIIYFLFNFFIITPYQYTYLNIFNGETKIRYKKFENDYWGVSINELIKNSNLDRNMPIKLALCGPHPRIFDYFKKRGYRNLTPSSFKQADYIIMTNRTLLVSGKLTPESTNKTVKIMNCFDRFEGEDIFVLKRNGLPLSVIRKKTDISNWN